ncbi:MmyB family transcriptional regulator [Nocardia takedensis]
MTPPPDPTCRREPPLTDPASLLTLGQWARQVREHRHLTRRRAAALMHVNENTLKNIELETPEKQSAPQPSTVSSFAATFSLNHAQERHTHNLAAPPAPLPTIEQLRALADTPENRAQMSQLTERGAACAYIDPLWNVVLANEPFWTALPGLEQFDSNLALWLFHPDPTDTPPASDHIVISQDEMAAYLTAATRGGLGRHRDSPRALTLLERLWRSPRFRHSWQNSIAVAYGRNHGVPVHLHDPFTDEPYTESVHVGFVPALPELGFCVGYRSDAHAGPPRPTEHHPHPNDAHSTGDTQRR